MLPTAAASVANVIVTATAKAARRRSDCRDAIEQIYRRPPHAVMSTLVYAPAMSATQADGSDQPVVVSRRREYECPWFEVVVKDIRYPGQARAHRHYSVQLNDWVAVLAVDGEGKIPLVRQYRPALERVELELPAGAVRDASPEETARRELLEETGYEADELMQLGSIFTEAGRLTSRAWIYFAGHARRVVEPVPGAEEPLECVVVTQTELHAAIASGAFAVSGHVAAVGLALIDGCLALPAG